MATAIAQLAAAAKSWPYQEAQSLLSSLTNRNSSKLTGVRKVTFATGYGPSGLPHLGTFAEVLRSNWVRMAFSDLTGLETQLLSVSDDMDALRKVPHNVPKSTMLQQHLGKPLSRIPDPFDRYPSYAAHNNARLREFLDLYNFDYTFISASEHYQSGKFDQQLLNVLRNYQQIMKILLPELGSERQKSYSPFLPICPETGTVLQVPVSEVNADKGSIVYHHPNGKKYETLVTGGNCKLQWKPDWGMRWAALGVDYEIYGKDLIPSARLAARVTKQLGFTPPSGLIYELFLDQDGHKISKSLGNGLGMEDWLQYAPPESLAMFLYNKPGTAKRLFFDVIPQAVDEFYRWRAELAQQQQQQQPRQINPEICNNPVGIILRSRKPAQTTDQATTSRTLPFIPADQQRFPATSAQRPIAFGLLLNLATVCQVPTTRELYQFLLKTGHPALNTMDNDELMQLLQFAQAYSEQHVRPKLHKRQPTRNEAQALAQLARLLTDLPDDADEQLIQNTAFAAGKAAGYQSLRDWFQMLYQCLLGTTSGPRIGSFFALYGLNNSIALIQQALDVEQH